MKRIYLSIILLLVLTIETKAIDCSDCDGWLNPGDLGYPTQEACYEDPQNGCGGIPINDHSYLLVTIGAISTIIGLYWAKKKRVV